MKIGPLQTEKTDVGTLVAYRWTHNDERHGSQLMARTNSERDISHKVELLKSHVKEYMQDIYPGEPVEFV